MRTIYIFEYDMDYKDGQVVRLGKEGRNTRQRRGEMVFGTKIRREDWLDYIKMQRRFIQITSKQAQHYLKKGVVPQHPKPENMT